jgi:hypothetical protein
MVKIDGPMTPEQALRIRNGLRWTAAESGRPYALDLSDSTAHRGLPDEDRVAQFNAMADCATKGELVIWENELWQVATAGAEAFLDTSLDRQEINELLTIPNQIWIFRNPWPANDPEWERFELDRPCKLLGFYVFGLLGIAGFMLGMDAEEYLRSHPDAQWEIGVGITWIFAPEGEPKTIPDMVHRYRLNMPYMAGRPIELWEMDVLAGLKFLSSNLARVSRARSSYSRQVQRARARKGDPVPDVSGVGVVELRRTVYRDRHDPKDAAHVDWQHQWIVRGHWRKQWYPGKQKHSPVFVEPYVKGPDDKPLKPPRESVYLVKR